MSETKRKKGDCTKDGEEKSAEFSGENCNKVNLILVLTVCSNCVVYLLMKESF